MNRKVQARLGPHESNLNPLHAGYRISPTIQSAAGSCGPRGIVAAFENQEGIDEDGLFGGVARVFCDDGGGDAGRGFDAAHLHH